MNKKAVCGIVSSSPPAWGGCVVEEMVVSRSTGRGSWINSPELISFAEHISLFKFEMLTYVLVRIYFGNPFFDG